ncbi:hypothetical protein LCGC14_1533160 [marine sediment metagenome]|uniref:Uncharacterized protein n=1 Tax=marine sediment metagenome TaxID=412755 RepID=A0A0F9JG66_9ZZZZ
MSIMETLEETLRDEQEDPPTRFLFDDLFTHARWVFEKYSKGYCHRCRKGGVACLNITCAEKNSTAGVTICFACIEEL